MGRKRNAYYFIGWKAKGKEATRKIKTYEGA
jgi:hypothetical protein